MSSEKTIYDSQHLVAIYNSYLSRLFLFYEYNSKPLGNHSNNIENPHANIEKPTHPKPVTVW